MPKPDHIGHCRDCAYFVAQPVDDGDGGHCYAMPAQVVQTGDVDVPIIKSLRPAVAALDWCGMWADPAVVAIELEERIAGTWRGDQDD